VTRHNPNTNETDVSSRSIVYVVLPIPLVLLIFVDTIYIMFRRFDRLFVPDDLHWYPLFLYFWPLVYFEFRPSIGRKMYLIAVGS
jgi:hypothetical protein